MRTSQYSRETKETEIMATVNLDGRGVAEVNTEIVFFNHLIRTLATHSLIDIKVNAKGDLKHHVVEDLAICLGIALNKAFGEERLGIKRFGYAIVPMDDTLAIAAIDLVKRPYSRIELKIADDRIEDMATEDIIHFLETLASSIQCTIHVLAQYGFNNHHKAEAIFKALALALREAATLSTERGKAPSAKGTM